MPPGPHRPTEVDATRGAGRLRPLPLLLAAAIAAGLVLAGKSRAPAAAEPQGSVALLGGDAGVTRTATRAAGCGSARASPIGETSRTRGGRTFHVWGPASYEPGRAYPVVLAFHGWGSNGRAFAGWFEMHEHVDGAAFTVYPDSSSSSWDFAGDRDLVFTEEILDALAGAYCVDRSRVLALGFSYGARFVHHLGCKRPDLVRAIAAGGGSWDPEEGCAAPQHVLVLHRTRDATMPIGGGRDAALRWARIDGCAGGEETTDPALGCVGHRGCAGGSVTFCEDTHHDPTWPRSWNHTVREVHRQLAWTWFEEVSGGRRERGRGAAP